jgi:hypothetical protein
VEEFKEELDSKLGLYVKALTFSGIPGGSVFYVLDDSGVALIVSSLLTLTIMGVILLSIVVHLQIQKMEEIQNGV